MKIRCTEYSDLLRVSGIAQEHAIFCGAAVCAVLASVLALVVFRQARPTSLAARDLLSPTG